jgi:hypothetical protein
MFTLEPVFAGLFHHGELNIHVGSLSEISEPFRTMINSILVEKRISPTGNILFDTIIPKLRDM